MPKGSILGPFLFLIMVNNLPMTVSLSPVLQTDDATLVSTAGEDSLQLVPSAARIWFLINGQEIYENKIQQMIKAW